MKYLISLTAALFLSVPAMAHTTGGFYDDVYLDAITGYLENRLPRCANPDSPAFRTFKQMFFSYREAALKNQTSHVELVTDLAESTTLRDKNSGRACTLYMPNGCVSAACN